MMTYDPRYPIRYLGCEDMDTAKLLGSARHSAGLSQDEVARRAGTSRPTLSSYENGRKSPTLNTATRLLAAVGYELAIAPHIEIFEHLKNRGGVFFTLQPLPRLPLEQALATVVLPLHLNWSTPKQKFRLTNRAERARAY